jgi:pyruvate carboxylase subunit B
VKYSVRVGTQSCEVEVTADGLTLDGAPLPAELAAIPGTPLFHLLLGGVSWTVAAEELDGEGHWALGVEGERIEVRVVDEHRERLAALGAAQPRPGGGGATTIQAPMPGLVVRVAVSVGQAVAAGAGVVVVEAMKMENELRAPRPGVVTAVHVAAGAAVEKGAPLVTLGGAEERVAGA